MHIYIYYTYYNLTIAISLPKYYCDSGVRVCWNGECMVRVSIEAFKDRIQAQIRIIHAGARALVTTYVQLVLITMQQHLAYIHNFILCCHGQYNMTIVTIKSFTI